MRITTVILIMIVLLPGLNSKAQVNCMNTLKEAKELYEQGLIEDIPKMLSGCMESGFTRVQRIEAYKLIIMSYLFDDNQFEAEKIMDEFLKKFPEYEVMPNDPVEFTYLLESYKTSSMYSINLYFGPNFSNPRITESYSVLDKNNTESDNKFSRGFQVGIGGSRNLVKGLNLNLDAFYSSHNFSKTEITKSPVENITSPMVTIYSKESLKKVDIPLSFTYTLGKGNLSYFGRLGFMYSFITQSTLTVERTHPDLQAISENVDIKYLRPAYCLAVIAGAGMQYKVPRGYLVLDLRYNYGLSEMSTTDNDFSNSILWSKCYYADDKFKLDFFSVNIGYYFTIYRSNRKRN